MCCIVKGTKMGLHEGGGNMWEIVETWWIGGAAVCTAVFWKLIWKERESEKKRGREAASQLARQSNRKTEKERKRTKGTENVGKKLNRESVISFSLLSSTSS